MALTTHDLQPGNSRAEAQKEIMGGCREEVGRREGETPCVLFRREEAQSRDGNAIKDTLQCCIPAVVITTLATHSLNPASLSLTFL